MSSYDGPLKEEDLQGLLGWIDQIPLSRKKKSLTRDFSDGLLVAEIVKHFFPRRVEIHNYVSASSVGQKLNNWGTLNRKVLSKMNYTVPADIMQKIAECNPGNVEVFLLGLWQKIEEFAYKERSDLSGYTPESRPYYHARTASEKNHNPNLESLPTSQPQQTDYAIKNPVPLAQLNLNGLDSQTRLILEEKEQALLASQETVQILQVKIRRLEHLLHLKDLRIQDMEQRITRYDSVSTLQSNQHH